MALLVSRRLALKLLLLVSWDVNLEELDTHVSEGR